MKRGNSTFIMPEYNLVKTPKGVNLYQTDSFSSSVIKNGGYLLSHFYAVPSTWLGLTSLFGMGRGGSPTL